MTPSIRRKLEQLAERHQELELLMSSHRFWRCQAPREVSREHAQLGPLREALSEFDANARDLAAARAMLHDPELPIWHAMKSTPCKRAKPNSMSN